MAPFPKADQKTRDKRGKANATPRQLNPKPLSSKAGTVQKGDNAGTANRQPTTEDVVMRHPGEPSQYNSGSQAGLATGNHGLSAVTPSRDNGMGAPQRDDMAVQPTFMERPNMAGIEDIYGKDGKATGGMTAEGNNSVAKSLKTVGGRLGQTGKAPGDPGESTMVQTPSSGRGYSSGPEATPELLERWEQALESGLNPEESRKILMEKEYGKDKTVDIYVKLPVDHVIRALNRTVFEGNASGVHVDNVMIPAKVSTSIATSNREVFKVATVADDAVFDKEAAPELRFSKEELDQIARAKRRNGAHKGGERTKSGSLSENPTPTRGPRHIEGGSKGPTLSLSSLTLQPLARMGSTPPSPEGPKRLRLTAPVDENHILNQENQDVVMAEPKFCILDGLLRNAELTLEMAKHLGIEELISLYAISKDFHHTINHRLTTTITSQAGSKAPDCADIFPFRCYNKLCIRDPAGRPHEDDERAAQGEIRKVPSFRWLRMVCYRDMVCREILTMLAEEGIRVPEPCEIVLKKIWFLLDIPDNNRRTRVVQNRNLWSDIDIFFAIMFFIKLDTRFTDPVRSSGDDGLKRLLMSQRSLTLLWKTLKRTALVTNMDVNQAVIRWKYQPRPDEQGLPIFGIPPEEIGKLQYEGWGLIGSDAKLERPDNLILRESIRREMDLEERYVEMFLWGFQGPNDPPSQWKVVPAGGQ
ncbi:hypothetical protein FQN54_009704 [Arachnomyces sp. PD_36]|nr:hypothetical protein FQN54_009704 [Arachnomyces sp. PD_36]